MADHTGIEWTSATWNPIVGCSIVSPGCTNCYAMKQAARIVAMQPASHYAGTVREVKGNAVWTGKLAQAPEHILSAPLRWRKPRRIFVNSMGDLFHEDCPDEWIDRVFAVMALAPQHTFQLLTKRSKRMREYCSALSDRAVAIAQRGVWLGIWDDPDGCASEIVTVIDKGILPNVHLGVSAEDQERWGERYPDLFETPAARRFVSLEPLLGRIDMCEALGMWWNQTMNSWEGTGEHINLDKWGGRKLDWAIAGGESGPKYRPMKMEWPESLQRQCKAAGVAYFFKQDHGPRSGMRGRASDELWAAKEFPK